MNTATAAFVSNLRISALFMLDCSTAVLHDPKFEVFAEAEKSFFAKVSDQQIVFETGPDGRATSLVLHTAGREMPAPRMP